MIISTNLTIFGGTAVYDLLAHLLCHIGIIGRILSAVASHILHGISLFLHKVHEFTF